MMNGHQNPDHSRFDITTKKLGTVNSFTAITSNEIKNEQEEKSGIIHYVFANVFLDQWLVSNNQHKDLVNSGKKAFEYFANRFFSTTKDTKIHLL